MKNMTALDTGRLWLHFPFPAGLRAAQTLLPTARAARAAFALSFIHYTGEHTQKNTLKWTHSD